MVGVGVNPPIRPPAGLYRELGGGRETETQGETESAGRAGHSVSSVRNLRVCAFPVMCGVA